MNKKKLTALVASLGLVACIGVGATLAYFTDSENTTNVITMGKVGIKLTEPSWMGPAESVVPNMTISKDPTVTLNSDSNDAYVRIKLEYKLGDEMLEYTDHRVKDLEETMDIDHSKWYKSGEYYYYNTKLTQDSNATTLFNSVTIPAIWGNEVAGEELDIIVTAEAIQADNFNPIKSDDEKFITGWDVPTALN